MAAAFQVQRRPGRPADREFLYELLRQALGPHVEATYGPWDEAWQRRNFLETSDPSAHEILEWAGAPIGCLLIETQPDRVELQRILLMPDHQNRGIGTALMHDLLRDALQVGKLVSLQVFRVSPALRFYERLGFQRVGASETHIVLEHAG